MDLQEETPAILTTPTTTDHPEEDLPETARQEEDRQEDRWETQTLGGLGCLEDQTGPLEYRQAKDHPEEDRPEEDPQEDPREAARPETMGHRQETLSESTTDSNSRRRSS